MEAFWTGLDVLEKFFVVCALISAMLFVVRVVVQLFGMGDHGVDADPGMDVGGMDGGDMGHGMDVGLHLLTIQGMTGFFLMFGLVGLMLSDSLDQHAGVAILGAVGAGTLTMVMLAKLTQMMLGLQSSGTLDVRNAIGQEGTVYMRIPAGGTGKVQVTVQERLQEFDAMAEDKQQIDTGERIEVVGLVSGSALVVKPLP